MGVRWRRGAFGVDFEELVHDLARHGITALCQGNSLGMERR